MMEDELLVDMRGDVFPIKLCIEFRGDGLDRLGFAEEEAKWHIFVLLLCALLGKNVWPHYLRVWVFFVPRTEEDVVLKHMC